MTCSVCCLSLLLLRNPASKCGNFVLRSWLTASSDRALLPILVWLLRRHFGSIPIQPEFADLRRLQNPPNEPASCITFLSEQAFAPQNTRFWSRSRVWFQFTVGEDKPPMLSVDNRGKGVLSMDCSAKRSPF